MSNNIYGIILAGGSGSRLWPLSREMYPKQLLKLAGDNSLFQSTFLRLSNIIPDINILTVTNIKHSEDIRIQLDEISKNKNQNKKYIKITEPIGRNTAPAIALSTFYVLKKLASQGTDPILLVAPSDHLIGKEDEFNKVILEGVKLAEAGFIVTFGVTPDKPDTGYGYIRTDVDNELKKITQVGLKVAEFKEKPDLATAQKYVDAGTYYWNGGIFMFKASVMLAEMQKLTPDIYDLLKDAELSEENPTISLEDYEKLNGISIDYAVMEKSSLITLVPIDCEWNDLGSWEAIYEVAEKDENNNYFKGNIIDIDSKNTMAMSTSKIVATIGLDNVIVVETDDAIMVCNKDKTQDVKKVFDTLKSANDSICMVHNKVYKPWGNSEIVYKDDNSVTSIITVNAGAKIKAPISEISNVHWVVLSGEAKVLKDSEFFTLSAGESLDITAGIIHSVENTSEDDLKILEIQRKN